MHGCSNSRKSGPLLDNLGALTILRACSPAFVRGWYTNLRAWMARLGHEARMKLYRYNVPSTDLSLSYAGVLRSRRGLKLHGGAVKLVHLESRFPENPRSFSIVYMVSSAQPRFALDYIERMRGRGAKFVWNQNGVAYPAWASSGYESTNQAMRLLRQHADYVVYQSDFCRRCADRFLGTVQTPWETIYNCVDTDVFTPRQRGFEANGPLVLLAAGTHQQKERVLVALEALYLLRRKGGRRFKLNIAGPLDWPNASRELDQAIRVLDISDDVEVLSAFHQKDAPDIYRAADILVHLKYKDPCPTVVIEAMACGVPVIGSNSGGLPELVGSEGGLLLDVPESWDVMHSPRAESVAEAVEKILVELCDWRDRCRSYARAHFDRQKWLARHEDIFRRLAA